MEEKIEFILNGQYSNLITDPKRRLLDVIREDFGLTGTKEGCSDGDCGACTVIIGSAGENGKVHYLSVASCLYPIGKMQGKSLVTIEGMSTNGVLNIIQQSIINSHGVQCGFCTPGIIMALSSALANHESFHSPERLMRAMDGNICRCTGYEGIKKAILAVDAFLDTAPVSFDILPEAIRRSESLLQKLNEDRMTNKKVNSISSYLQALETNPNAKIIAGNTDMGVKAHNTLENTERPCIDISDVKELNVLYMEHDSIHIGAAVTITSLLESPLVKEKLPIMQQSLHLMASEHIRNVATIGGNIANASPIADGTLLLTALSADLILLGPDGKERRVQIQNFFHGYKMTDLRKGELIREIVIPIPYHWANAIKTGKRKGVDIAIVNSTAIQKCKDGDIIIAFGGVAANITKVIIKPNAIPQDPNALLEVAKSIADNIHPISDVRGSKEYRSQLIKGHIIKHCHAYREKEENNDQRK